MSIEIQKGAVVSGQARGLRANAANLFFELRFLHRLEAQWKQDVKEIAEQKALIRKLRKVCFPQEIEDANEAVKRARRECSTYPF